LWHQGEKFQNSGCITARNLLTFIEHGGKLDKIKIENFGKKIIPCALAHFKLFTNILYIAV
jgi:hypothetical protein